MFLTLKRTLEYGMQKYYLGDGNENDKRFINFCNFPCKGLMAHYWSSEFAISTPPSEERTYGCDGQVGASRHNWNPYPISQENYDVVVYLLKFRHMNVIVDELDIHEKVQLRSNQMEMINTRSDIKTDLHDGKSF